MKISKWATVAAASLVYVLGMAGTNDAWLGSWKLDKAKSNFAGDTMTYSKSANGLYHYSDGSTESFDFGTDGKEYPALHGRTTTWTAAGDHAWDSETKAKGTVLYKAHRALSDGDKTLTITGTGTKPDGSTFNESSVYTRVSGTSGLVGKWRSIKSDAGSPDLFVVTSPSPGVFHYEIPDYKQSTEGKLDGSDHPVTGPTAPPGLTFGGKFDSPTKLSYVLKFDGKPTMYGRQTMAADGASYTDVSWSPGKEDEKSTAVYVKQ